MCNLFLKINLYEFISFFIFDAKNAFPGISDKIDLEIMEMIYRTTIYNE